MKEKLSNFMKNEGLTSSRLAEILETQPSSISHIISGRNKPGFDLLQKILQRFPKVNPDWLLLDSEQMYRSEEVKKGDELASVIDDTNRELFSPSDSNKETKQIHEENTNSLPKEVLQYANIAPNRDEIEVITIMYRDGTFKSYTSRG